MDRKIISAYLLRKKISIDLTNLNRDPDIFTVSTEEAREKFNLSYLPDELKHAHSPRLLKLQALRAKIKSRGGKLPKENINALEGNQIKEIITAPVFKQTAVLTIELIDRLIKEEIEKVDQIAGSYTMDYGVYGKDEVVNRAGDKNHTGADNLLIQVKDFPKKIKDQLSGNTLMKEWLDEVLYQSAQSRHPRGYGWARVHKVSDKEWEIHEIQCDIQTTINVLTLLRGLYDQYRHFAHPAILREAEQFLGKWEDKKDTVAPLARKIFSEVVLSLMTATIELAHRNNVETIMIPDRELKKRDFNQSMPMPVIMNELYHRIPEQFGFQYNPNTKMWIRSASLNKPRHR